MRAARFYAVGDVRIGDVLDPTPQSDQVIVEVEWAGICGSDPHEYSLGSLVIPRPGHPHAITGDTLPVTLGHEFCGRVSSVPTEGLKGAGGEVSRTNWMQSVCLYET